MGWLIAFAIVFLLAIMPIGLRVSYDCYGPRAVFMIGPLQVKLYPRPKKNRNSHSEKKQPEGKSTGSEKTRGGSVSDFLPLVRLVLEFLKDFRRRLAVDNLQLTLILGGTDPCDLALNYGKCWAALGNVMPLLERALVIKKRNLEVECDFTTQKTTVIAAVDLTLRIWHLAVLGVTHGPGVIKEYFNIMNKRKGGVKT